MQHQFEVFQTSGLKRLLNGMRQIFHQKRFDSNVNELPTARAGPDNKHGRLGKNTCNKILFMRQARGRLHSAKPFKNIRACGLQMLLHCKQP